MLKENGPFSGAISLLQKPKQSSKKLLRSATEGPGDVNDDMLGGHGGPKVCYHQ